MKQILFASFESLPFVKTGGLADVVYALPKAIDQRAYEVRVILPLLKKIKTKYFAQMEYLCSLSIHSGILNDTAGLYTLENEGIRYYFVAYDNYFDRDEVYGYADDAARFAFYNNAILEALIALDYYPDILHEHDYHTALLPALCKIRFRGPRLKKIKHVLTIHNLAYQGFYDKQVLFDLLGFDYRYYEDGSLRFNDAANFMKIGLVYADAITTVSRTYAEEIRTKEYGEGLEAILEYRKEDLYGIVNGIDTKTHDPATTPIFKNYSKKDRRKGKLANKLELQRALGLKEDPDVLLIGMVSRLTFQKGVELLLNELASILEMKIQVAILGTGEKPYEEALRNAENAHRGQFVFYNGYNEDLASQMYAGLDLLLMPSLFEPCGISQLIAMRYGTLPLVRETGGLKDTVEPLNEYQETGRGFSFGPYAAYDFKLVLDYAYKQYYQYPERWAKLIKNAMDYDVSFRKSAAEYEQLYDKLVG